jgi:hypothetical protein
MALKILRSSKKTTGAVSMTVTWNADTMNSHFNDIPIPDTFSSEAVLWIGCFISHDVEYHELSAKWQEGTLRMDRDNDQRYEERMAT